METNLTEMPGPTKAPRAAAAFRAALVAKPNGKL
jgi:hypothetical protein